MSFLIENLKGRIIVECRLPSDKRKVYLIGYLLPRASRSKVQLQRHCDTLTVVVCICTTEALHLT